MAPSFSLVSELNPSRVEWAMKLRLIRVYSLHAFGEQDNVYSTECLFHDSEGNRIHATIKRNLMSKFTGMLREEHLYAIKNFVVADNGMKFKTSISPYKIIFIGKTHLVEIFDSNFPRLIFDFKMYDDPSSLSELDESLLIDVIGRLSSRGTHQKKEIQGKETSMLDITLENLQGITLACTIWGDIADELFHYLENNNDMLVIVMQLCRMRKYKGEVRVSNTYHVSKVIYDQTVREIEDFRSRIVLEGAAPGAVHNVPLAMSESAEEDLESSKDRVRTLDQILKTREIGNYWVYCEIVAVENMYEWYYISCKHCYKKLTPAGGIFYCEYCDSFERFENPRYKIQVRVVDNCGTSSLILWDKECSQIIGKSAVELAASANGDDVPVEIAMMVGLVAFFKIQIKGLIIGYNVGTHSVVKMTSDKRVIEKYSLIDCKPDIKDKGKGPAEGSSSSVNGFLNEGETEWLNFDTPKGISKMKTVGAEVCFGVKRCLMDGYSPNHGTEQKPAKVAKCDGDAGLSLRDD